MTIRFSRNELGAIDLSESACRRVVDHLTRNAEEPWTFDRAVVEQAARAAVRATWDIADRKGISFAATSVILFRERPALCEIARAEHIRDGQSPDVFIDPGDLRRRR